MPNNLPWYTPAGLDKNLPVPAESALNKVNVKRLLCVIQNSLDGLLDSSLFEPNDSTNSNMQICIDFCDQYLNMLKAKGAIDSYTLNYDPETYTLTYDVVMRK